MSIDVREQKQLGLVTLLCDGQWVIVAGKVVAQGGSPASPSAPTRATPAGGGASGSPVVPLPLDPPPPTFSVAGVGPKLLDVKMHKLLRPAFDNLVNASEFRQFARSLNNEFVLTISPTRAKKPAKLPARIATAMGDLPILHRYVEIE